MKLGPALAAGILILGLVGTGASIVAGGRDETAVAPISPSKSAKENEPFTLRCTDGTASPGVRAAQRNDLVLGPLKLLGVLEAAREPASAWRGGNGGDSGWSTPVVVRSGSSVTLRLAPSARRTASLAYGARGTGASRVRDGMSEIRFRACAQRGSADGGRVSEDSWPGAILVARRACVPVDIVVDDGEAVRAELGMGRRDCRARSVGSTP